MNEKRMKSQWKPMGIKWKANEKLMKTQMQSKRKATGKPMKS